MRSRTGTFTVCAVGFVAVVVIAGTREWWLLIPVALICLGALGYLERLFKWRWSAKWDVVLLTVFILLMSLQAWTGRQKEDRLTRLAQPVTLKLPRYEVTKLDDGYEVLMPFKPSKNESLGELKFTVTAESDTAGRILGFLPSTRHHAYFSGDDVEVVADDGLAARTRFIIPGNRATVRLTVSAAGRFLVEGNRLKLPVTVVVRERIFADGTVTSHGTMVVYPDED